MCIFTLRLVPFLVQTLVLYDLRSTFFAVVDLNGCPEEQVLNGSQPDMDDVIPCDNLDDEPAQMIEELHSGIDNADEEAKFLVSSQNEFL